MLVFLLKRFLPTLVDMSVDGGWGASDRCVSVAGGWSHSLAVTACGMAYGWGCGADGRIGVGCYSDQLRPTRIFLYDNVYDDRHEDVGGDGDTDSQSKDSSADRDENLAYSLKERERPVFPSDNPIRKAVAGYAHSAFLTSSGMLYTCGCGVSGQLARFESIKSESHTSGQVDSDRHVKDEGFDAASRLSEMIPAVVSLVPRPVQWPRCGGDATNADGTACKDDQCEEDIVTGSKVLVDVACGDHHTVAISASGELYTWGLDQAGQCSGYNSSQNGQASPWSSLLH